MKREVTFFLVALAIAISGCLCIPPESTPSPMPMDVNALPSIDPLLQASPSPQATTQAIHPFDPGRAQWIQYKVTEGGGSPYDLKLEYSESSAGGATKQSVKRTISASNTGSNNGYSYDPATNSFKLQQSSSSSSSSSGTQTTAAGIKADDPALSSGELTYSAIGSESITVPKGTFQCDKYTADFKGTPGTFWASKGIPVPVKIAYGQKIMELADWG